MGFYKIKKILIFSVILISAFLLLFFNSDFSKGAEDGILLSLNTVIPSTFPFLILSAFACKVDAFSPICKILSKPFMKIFKLQRKAIPITLFAFIGGYPAGAVLSCEAYEKGSLSTVDVEKILCFCVMGSPTFIVGGVGKSFFNDSKLGFILLGISVISNLICGFLFCNLPDFKRKDDTLKNKDFKRISSAKIPENILDSLIDSVYKSSKNTLIICAYVVASSAITNAVLSIAGDNKITNIICALIEVTGGVKSALKIGGIPFVAGILTFGGFAVFLQILSLTKGKINPLKFLIARLFSAIISFFLMKIALIFYNPVTDVFSNINKANPKLYSVNPFLSVGLVFLAFFMILSANRQKGKVDFSGDL
jgi:hypothetical protein